MKIKNDPLVRYSFKGPGWGRKSFTIYTDIKYRDGRREFQTVKDERLNAINRAYAGGAQSLEACRIQVKEIVEDLYKKDHRCHDKFTVHNEENRKVVEKYWQQVYSFRPLICEANTKNELGRAIETLGTLSIYSASRDEVQKCIDKKYSGNAQRRMIQRMTQLLKFIGRADVRLRKNPPEHISVSHLNETDFKSVLRFAQSDVEKSLLKLCYHSGLRVGEAYALEPHSLLKNGTLRVGSQIDRSGKRRHTKNRRPRLAYLCAEGLSAFHAWVNFSSTEKETINRQEVSRHLMKKYCRMAFPNDKSKHLTFHALRHCYAINLLNKGVSMSLVAQSLGNTLSVCQQYYVGYELTNESIEAITAILGRTV